MSNYKRTGKAAIGVSVLALALAACTKERSEPVVIKGQTYVLTNVYSSGSFSAPVNYYYILVNGREVRCDFKPGCIAKVERILSGEEDPKPKPEPAPKAEDTGEDETRDSN